MKKINHKKIRFTCEQFLNKLKIVDLQQESPWGGPNVFFWESC